MSPNLENDGPSDEEVSLTSTNSLLRTPTPHKSKRSRGKSLPQKDMKPSPQYESFRRRSRSAYSRDDSSENDGRERRQSSPSKEVARARQVLVHYHPQMGDEGYESTLVEVSRPLRGKSSPPSSLRGSHGYGGVSGVYGKKVGGMHSRMIDDHRDQILESNIEEDAEARQMRRRMFRMTLERNVSMESKRKMRGDELNKSFEEKFETSLVNNKGGRVHPLKKLTVSTHEDGDIPLNKKLSTPTSPSESIPPPPTNTPSYRTIVTNLIKNNEPEKLTQIDRVMQKYLGREEELIHKLDLRYKKKRRQRAQGSSKGGEVKGGSKGESVQSHDVEQDDTLESPGYKQSKNDVKDTDDSLNKNESQMYSSTEHKGETTEEAIPSPKKERSAIQTMQTWDKRHNDKDVNSTTDRDGPELSADIIEQQERLESNLAISTRTSSTKTELHSNLEKEPDNKDNMDDEGRLPKVPEQSTPPRGEKTSQGSPYNDDISLITMETKGTYRRFETSYSYAEMMRRPPASIIVDGGQKQHDCAKENAEEYGQSTQKEQMAPPQIQRLAYESVSSKLDSVEDRILARRKLREEALTEPRMEMKTLEENSTMAFDEEESFLRRQQQHEAPGAIESVSLLEQGSLDGVELDQRSLDGESALESMAVQGSREEKFNVLGKLRNFARPTVHEDVEVDTKRETEERPNPTEENRSKESVDYSSRLSETDTDLVEKSKPMRSLGNISRNNVGDTMVYSSQLAGPDTKPVNESNPMPVRENRSIPLHIVEDEEDAPLDEKIEDSFQSKAVHDDIQSYAAQTAEEDTQDASESQSKYTWSIQTSDYDEDWTRQVSTKSRRVAPRVSDDEDSARPAMTKSVPAAKVQTGVHNMSPIQMQHHENPVQKQDCEAETSSPAEEAATRDAEIQLRAMEDEIARLIAEKESRFAAEKAVALKQAEKALEEERKARLEAEEARLKAEKELERLKNEADQRLQSIKAMRVIEQSKADALKVIEQSNAESEAESSAEESRQLPPLSDRTASVPMPEDEGYIPKSNDDTITVRKEDRVNMPAETDEGSASINSMDKETKQELMSMIAAMEESTMRTIKDQPATAKSEVVLADANRNFDESDDIVEKMRSVWALDEDEESQHEKYAATSDDESDYEDEAAVAVQRSLVVADDDGENDSTNSNDKSYLPGSLQNSPERNPATMPMQHDFPPMTVLEGPLDQSSIPNNAEASHFLSKNDHDIPSMYMPHKQTSAAQILDTTESMSLQTETTLKVNNESPKKPSLMEEDGEANIHHVAKVTFDGNPAKGQLSFTTGSEVLAHSNQRGEWWLGRCGGRTGWFPASAVVPASEFLRNLGPMENATSLGAEHEEEDLDDVDMEFEKLSEEELHKVYDLIRSPSGDDDSPQRPSKHTDSPRPDPSDALGLKGESNESYVDNQNEVKSVFDSMMDKYGSMVSPVSKEKPNENDNSANNVSGETKQSDLNKSAVSTGEKKPKRLWRSANDPNTGLTYYYNIKTRETTWEKPADFVEKKSGAKPTTPTTPTQQTSTPAETSKPGEGEAGIKEAVAKEPLKSGNSKRFLGLFSSFGKKSNPETSSNRSTTPTNISVPNYRTNSPPSNNVPQAAKSTDVAEEDADNDATIKLASSINDNWEVRDDDGVSSVSSEGTSNSIFSALKVKQAFGKVSSKITGKMSNSPNTTSYNALNDSMSPQKSSQVVDKKSINVDIRDDVMKQSNEGDETVQQTAKVESTPEPKTTPDKSIVKPRTKQDSRWRAAIDPLTGRTYYFHKDTKETVWEKPTD